MTRHRMDAPMDDTRRTGDRSAVGATPGNPGSGGPDSSGPDPEDPRYHYAVMRRAIDAIDRLGPQATLTRLAAELGMSPAHFQRTFSAWVGVSPKRYQQHLALGQAKALLAERHTTLEAAAGAGLSGSGRLHDLFLRWEAMRPGDYARGGAGLTITEGCFDSPFGPVLAMGTDIGLCGLAFTSECGTERARDDLRARWPNATWRTDPDRIGPWVAAVFDQPGRGPSRGSASGNGAYGAPPSDAGGARDADHRQADVPLHLIGAPFQIKVWEALLQVPSGHVTTYSDIATAIGAPRAVRAVGTAVGRNPIGFLIPCHRALRKSGGLGGYHWGLPVKRAMLAWEAARDAPQS